MDNNFIDFPYSLSSRVWGSTTRSANDISIRNNLIEKANRDKVLDPKFSSSFVPSFPSKYPSPISISRALRLNDVSRWKKRKEKKKREKGKISNRVLNWSNRWQEWKLHIFSRPVTELSLPLSLSLFLSFSTKEFELFYYIEYHFTLESILLYSRCRLSSRFAILFISNREI